MLPAIGRIAAATELVSAAAQGTTVKVTLQDKGAEADMATDLGLGA